jgi:hypothetical protein
MPNPSPVTGRGRAIGGTGGGGVVPCEAAAAQDRLFGNKK